MTAISQPIPSFLNGVSQQPFALRGPSQGTAQQHSFSSPVVGLTKRPNTENVAKLNTGSDEAYTHDFDRHEDDRGTIIIPGDGSIVIKGVDGVSKTIDMVAGGSYITTDNPLQDLHAITLADYTFIVNKAIVPEMEDDTWPDPVDSDEYSMVWVRQGQLDREYKIILSDLTATYKPDTAGEEATNDIAEQLKLLIHGLGAAGGRPNYHCVRKGSVLFIHRLGVAHDIDVEDGLGAQGLILCKGRTNDVTNLPPHALDGYQLEIVGDEATEFDNYWLQYLDGKKAWVEVPEPGRKYKIDRATMPHVLFRNPDGTYKWMEIEKWNDCPAGDEDTNPEPSFIGKAINDMFFYRGRLGFLTDTTVVMSESGNLFNFWRTTVTQLLDSDPIDVEVTMKEPAPLHWAVEFNGSMFFCNRRAQFELPGGLPVLTPASIVIQKVTSYEMDTACRPVAAGSRFYFPVRKGKFSAVFEMRAVSSNSQLSAYEAEEVTEHVPQYIRGRVTKLIPCAKDNLLLAMTDNNDSRVYAYQYSVAPDGQRVQSAWHVWPFNTTDKPAGGQSIDGELFLLFYRADGLWLEKMSLEPLVTDEGMDFKLLLDRRINQDAVSMSYNDVADQTLITMPYSDAGDFELYGNAESVSLSVGERIVLTRHTEAGGFSRFIAQGDMTDENFYIGRTYTAYYKLSTLVLREARMGGIQVAATGGRLQLQRAILNHGESGYFRVVVTPRARSPYTYVFTGRSVGVSTVPIGAPPFVAGTFKFPIMARNEDVDIEIINDSPFPHRILNGEWEAQYVNRARRL